MAFKGNKQTATYHNLDYVQDRCAIDKMPADKLVESETEFSGPVEGRAAMRNGNVPIWKECAHCKRAREKANAPAPEPQAEAPKAKRESKKAKAEREAAEAAAAASGDAEEPAPPVVPTVESPPEPVDLFADAPAP